MQTTRPALFRRRHFQDHVIVLCVRWYLRRDMEELMAECGLAVDHPTIEGWVLRYAPEARINPRIDTVRCYAILPKPPAVVCSQARQSLHFGGCELSVS